METKKQKHFHSVFDNEQKLLKAIIEIHNEGKTFDVDPMFFKGNFYKEIERPKLIFDLNPLDNSITKADARKLPIANNSVGSIILDPPFMFGIHGQSDKYYSSRTHGIFKDFDELYLCYQSLIKEANRVLNKRGILVFKCQDYTDSSSTMIHCIVFHLATLNEFYAKDLAILNLPKNKVANHNLKQRHLRKVHSYFWVFQKLNEVNK